MKNVENTDELFERELCNNTVMKIPVEVYDKEVADMLKDIAHYSMIDESDVIRSILKEYLSKYTGVPDSLETNLTRIEVVGQKGREFSKRLKDSYYEVSIQDKGKTIKLFESKD